MLEARLLTGSTSVLYRFDNQSDLATAHVEVINFLREVQAFLTATWLVEDNSANCELAFAFCQDTEHAHSNSLALHYNLHSGAKRVMSVDKARLLEICVLHRENFSGIREQDAPTRTNFRKSTGRLSRAMLFLQQARSADDIGQKIANYCSFFEALLSTSSVELSHQLAERVAFFLCDKPTERLTLFKQIKRAYGVRSKIVHGDVLAQGAIDSLVDVSSICDQTARKLVCKIIASESLTKLFDQSGAEVLDSYMMNLIFGVTPPADIGAALTEA